MIDIVDMNNKKISSSYSGSLQIEVIVSFMKVLNWKVTILGFFVPVLTINFMESSIVIVLWNNPSATTSFHNVRKT
jgi:hypothetical protein